MSDNPSQIQALEARLTALVLADPLLKPDANLSSENWARIVINLVNLVVPSSPEEIMALLAEDNTFLSIPIDIRKWSQLISEEDAECPTPLEILRQSICTSMRHRAYGSLGARRRDPEGKQ